LLDPRVAGYGRPRRSWPRLRCRCSGTRRRFRRCRQCVGSFDNRGHGMHAREQRFLLRPDQTRSRRLLPLYVLPERKGPTIVRAYYHRNTCPCGQAEHPRKSSSPQKNNKNTC
jgi:hypothetical protein